jgi:hypothetical protein
MDNVPVGLMDSHELCGPLCSILAVRNFLWGFNLCFYCFSICF